MWTRLYLCVASVATAMVAAAPPLDTRKNVFLIIVDDLRPELLGAYSQPGLITPNLDRLANSSTVFERAYCQQVRFRLLLLTTRVWHALRDFF